MASSTSASVLNRLGSSFLRGGNKTVLFPPRRAVRTVSAAQSNSSTVTAVQSNRSTVTAAPWNKFWISAVKFFSHGPEWLDRPAEIIEHIVLLKVKDDADPSKMESAMNGLKRLRSSTVAHLSAGPIHKNKSSSPLRFTHIVHARFSSKQDLVDYSAHIAEFHTGNISPICDDMIVMDWVNPDVNGPVVLKPGSAMRVTFMKLKEGLSDEHKHEVYMVAKGLKGYFTFIEQSSVGVSFSSVESSKGFSVVAVSISPDIDQLEAADSGEYFKTCKANPLQYLICDVGVYCVVD